MKAAQRHDPGGKVRLPIMRGMAGGASFGGAHDEYRTLLWRMWSDRPSIGVALWIGMNPSTADADSDDPTVRREIARTMRWPGFGVYVKANLADYRATNPAALRTATMPLRSPRNLPTIKREARRAARVILACGAVQRALRPYLEDTVAMLQADGIPLWCLGTTADGSPAHPLYLPYDASLMRYTVP